MKKNHLRINLFFMLILFSTSILAQKQITGTVTSEYGPLPGVTVLVKGTTNGTTTDFDGNYVISNISKNETLLFSYLGYKDVEVVINDQSSVNVIMEESAVALDDVVVVGYGAKKRSQITSSISTVGSKELAKVSVPNLQSALSGRLSGVFSRQTSGEPGKDGANIRIRGFGNALIVVDGIQGRDYSDLDPNEIESISVLKDAASAAVYGAQGANGVVLVTTKRGKFGKTKVSISTRYGLQQPHRMPQTASTALWQDLISEYRANERLITDRNAVITDKDLEQRVYDYDTNWYNVLLRDAPISQSNLSVSGGTEKVKYFFSGGFLHQEGIWNTNSVSKDRFNLRSNVDVDFSDALSLSVGFGSIINKLEYPGASAELIAVTLRSAPYIPVKYPGFDEYASPTRVGGGNPVALADSNASGYNLTNNRTNNIDLSAEYKVPFLEGLSFKGVVGYNTFDGWNKVWSTDIIYNSYAQDIDQYFLSNNATNADKASLSRGDQYRWNLTLQGFVKYKRTFGDHNVNLTLIQEQIQANHTAFGASVGDYPSTVLDQFSGGLNTINKTATDWVRPYRSRGTIGRFSYDYKTKYLVDFNFRRDVSQYFAQPVGFFPSVSAGWVVTKEDFMDKFSKTITELKLKASWGQLGDLSAANNYYSNTGRYYHQSGFVYPGTALTFGDRTLYNPNETVEANPDFTWSKSTILNVGLNARLWGDQLSLSAEYFVRDREGLPAKRNNDNAGALATFYNLNSDRTAGFDVSLGHNNEIGDFKYSFKGNLSWARTKNIYNEDSGQWTNGYSKWKWDADGNWNNVRWGQNLIGRYQTQEEINNAPMHGSSNLNSAILPGDFKYEDYNGDGYIDEYDQKPIGRGVYPELIFGANFTAEWKGFDFSMFWQGAALSQFNLGIFDRAAFAQGNTDVNTWSYFGDRWRKADYTDPNSAWISGKYPAIRDFFSPSINAEPSRFYNKDGKYVRLKNIELGYSLPSELTEKLNIVSLRVYVNATNALTFSTDDSVDPEQRQGGFNLASYPQIRSINYGVNLKF